MGYLTESVNIFTNFEPNSKEYMDNRFSKCPSGFYIMLGLVVLAVMMPVSVNVFKSSERTVAVKGLCEMEIQADKVIWPLSFKVVGNDITQIYAENAGKCREIESFLKAGGISEAEITTALPKISDKFAQEYGSNDRTFRYVLTQVITVCSTNVPTVLELMQRQSALIAKDIVFQSDWDCQTRFLFEGLNEIKPQMIEEATRNAREVAQKFAKDSGSRLGKIKNATQGTFSIEDRDVSTPEVKKVRVVTNVTYYLTR